MKKFFYYFIANAITISASAQCNTNIDAHNTTTICKKEYEISYRPTKEQEKWMTNIYTTIVEPSINKTKGLRGNWKPMGNFPITPEGFIKSDIEMYVNLLGCNKEHKLVEKDEQGLILNFYLNAFTSEIASICRHQEDEISKGQNNTIYVNDLMEGKQIYILGKQTPSVKYKNVPFYRQIDDGKYFIITNSDIPLFIPLTVKQALEVNKQNILNRIKTLRQSLSLPDFKPETRAEYEKRMAKDFAFYRSTFPNPEKYITDLIKSLDETKLGALKGIQFFIDYYTKNLGIITDYLNSASSKELYKPCISYFDFLNGGFENKEQINKVLLEDSKEKTFVILNPAYFNPSISKTAPQFISIALREQGNSETIQNAFNVFESNLDLDRLQKILVK
jgi:hypothetical protein